MIGSIQTFVVEKICSTAKLREIAQQVASDFVVLNTQNTRIEMGMYAEERVLNIAADTNAVMLYADHYRVAGDERKAFPVIDYQFGSLRDDFDFGALLFFRADAFKQAVAAMDCDYRFGALYDLRLRISQLGEIVHINEYLYTAIEEDARKSGEKIFDYVDPKNREVQIEMEQVCTEHLKRIGGYLKPEFKEIRFEDTSFEYEASVIIPVFNRIRTIEDAIRSVLSQKADFKFNLIVVDNHSTDGTTDVIRKYADDPRLIHIIPERRDLGIGGCWNLGIHHPQCGKFAVQLDSDDIYADENTLT